MQNENCSPIMKLLRHNDFLNKLQKKAHEYNYYVKIITEENTTSTCTNCGVISNKYLPRVKICEDCGYKIDRDINDAQNILLKSLNLA